MKKMPKWLFISLICLGAAAVAAGAILIAYNLFGDGAGSPEEALWKYQRACMVYDARTMVGMSSDYNRRSLSKGGEEMPRGELIDYLKGIYSKSDPYYDAADLSYKINDKMYYDEGSDKFAEQSADYTGSAERFCLVTMTVYNKGSAVLKTKAWMARENGKWFYYRTD